MELPTRGRDVARRRERRGTAEDNRRRSSVVCQLPSLCNADERRELKILVGQDHNFDLPETPRELVRNYGRRRFLERRVRRGRGEGQVPSVPDLQVPLELLGP